MPKLKTNRGAAKRLKVSARGKVMRAQSGLRHGMRRKARGHKRRLKGLVVVADTEQTRMLRLLGKR
jgi:large subunit ribosomal protein L35